MYIRYLIFFISLSFICHSQPIRYVNNQQCLTCHHTQTKQWQHSDHYYSMLPAKDETVLGDFNDATYENKQQKVTFYKKDNQFFIKLKTQNKPEKIYQVKYTFGYHPLQQYLLVFPKGKLQVFNIAWDTINKKWFNAENSDDLADTSPFHWTKRFYNWNHSCAECHSTNFQKNYTDKKGYKSQFSGVNVNCQACHGPGSQHIQWAQRPKGKNNGLVTHFNKMSSTQKVDLCAHCHSRRAQVTAVHDPSQSFHDQYLPSLLRPDLYYPDGQIKEEVFVYGSFIQSKMSQAGVQCMDCHNPHSLKLTLPGNQVCTQCHNPHPEKRFPELKGRNTDYNAVSHTHHKKGTIGAQCVSCHMPETTYMKVDPRRDHSFKVPNPELTIKYGIPNACNRCHQDKSPKWALNYIKKWYGRVYYNSPVLNSDDSELLKIYNDKNQPDIFRSSALMLLPIKQRTHMLAVLSALKEPSPLIKRAALTKMQQFGPAETKPYLEPLLHDQYKTIRGQTAGILTGLNLDTKAYRNALASYQTMQQANIDQPESILNLAQLSIKQGDMEKAFKLLGEAIHKDKHFVPAYIILAQLYTTRQKTTQTIDILKQGIKYNPERAELYFNLALALAEKKHFAKAKQALEQTLNIDAHFPRAQYNLDLIDQKLKGSERE